ncbi:type IX secretion system protein PorQ [Saprospiraceae bacterium]|nr:type IX secretion system protein PorQ [Saprospiraceae bacterium]
MINRLLLFCFLSICCLCVNAQQGGTQLFSFLNQSPSSYALSQGGIMISNASQDISTALQNPATLNELTRNAISFNHTFHFSGINAGYFAYGNQFKKSKLDWHAAMQYTNYGEFQGADEWGNKGETFKAGDYALIFGVTKHLNEKFHVGVNSKVIYSRIENYIATGIGFDIGGYYALKDKNASIGVVAKNLGTVVKSYNSTGGLLPFDLQVGFSKKLKYLPFRYNVTAHHLYKWDVRFDDPNLVINDSFLEDASEPNIYVQGIDNVFRHLIFGGEFLLGKKENLKVRFSYNHMLRQELAIRNLRSITGFSGGVELKVKQFFIGYSFGLQHQHGSVKQLSITTNFGRFKKKAKA